MRLAQLARKLSIKQSEIVAFLANQNIALADNSNARVDAEHMRVVVQHFAPHLLDEVFTQEAEEQNTPEPVFETVGETQPIEAVAIPQEDATTTADAVLPEVIKAPKIELQGLKVLGKIELPETKNKEAAEQNQEGRPTRERRDKKSFERKDLPGRQAGKRNPIALQREREEREAEQLRQEKLKAEKELKTKRYLSKVKPRTTQPTKLVKEELEHLTDVAEPQPTTLFGRFWRWLRT